MAKKITRKAVISKAVVDAVRKGLDAEAKALAPLKAMGEIVAAAYPTAESLKAIRTQFITETILPLKRYAEQRKIILAPLGKKDTPEGIAIRDAKANARATVGMAFGSVLKYAFPRVKSTETRGRKANPDHLKIAKHLDAALKIARDSSSGMFDAVKVTGGIKVVLAMLPRAIEPNTTEPGRRKVTTPKAPAKRKAPRANKSTVPGTVGLGKPKQVIKKMLKDRKAKLAKSNIISARELTGAVTH